jgi:hypothetical protein
MESTDAEGRFKLLTIPGPAMVMAQIHSGEKFNGEHLSPYRMAVPNETDRKQFKYDAEDDTWTIETAGGLEFLSTENAIQFIDVRPEGETKVELFAERGATATLAVQDATGKPLSGAWVAGLTEHWPITFRLPDRTATVYALDAKKPRTLAIYHPEKKLGGTVVIRGDETEPVAVKLGPLGGVTGLLRDTDGVPMAAVDVSINPAGTIGSELERFANPSGKPGPAWEARAAGA